MDGRHELVRRVERNFGLSRIRTPCLHGIDAKLRREHHESCFGWVADHRTVVADRCIAVESEPVGKRSEIGVRSPGDTKDGPVLLVTDTLNSQPLLIRVDEVNHHLVHRQRAGLVCVDGAGRSQGLHVGQVLDHCLCFRELLRSIGQHRLDEGREARRDRRDRHGRAKKEEFVEFESTRCADRDDDRHRTPGDDAEDLGQLVQLSLERRTLALHGFEHGSDLAHLRRHTRGRDDDGARTSGDRGVLIEHADTIAESDVLIRKSVRILRNGGALPGEGRLLRLERC